MSVEEERERRMAPTAPKLESRLHTRSRLGPRELVPRMLPCVGTHALRLSRSQDGSHARTEGAGRRVAEHARGAPALAHRLPRPAAVARHHRLARHHGLQRHDSKVLVCGDATRHGDAQGREGVGGAVQAPAACSTPHQAECKPRPCSCGPWPTSGPRCTTARTPRIPTAPSSRQAPSAPGSTLGFPERAWEISG